MTPARSCPPVVATSSDPAPPPTATGRALEDALWAFLRDHPHNRGRLWQEQQLPKRLKATPDAVRRALRNLQRRGLAVQTDDHGRPSWVAVELVPARLSHAWASTPQIAAGLGIALDRAETLLKRASRGGLIEQTQRGDGIAMWRLASGGRP